MLQSPFRAFFIFVVEGLVPCSSKSFYKIMCSSVWNSFFSEIIQWFVFFFKKKLHCLESACIRSYSGPHFPAFGLNRERYWRDTLYLSVFSPNAGIHGPEQWIRTPFTQCLTQCFKKIIIIVIINKWKKLAWPDDLTKFLFSRNSDKMR